MDVLATELDCGRLTAEAVQRKLMKTIRQRQLNFLGHVKSQDGMHGLGNLAITGKVDGRRGRGSSLCVYLMITNIFM